MKIHLRGNRRGVQMLVLAAVICVIGIVLGVSSVFQSRTVLQWTKRIKADLAVEDLAYSAVEEATHEFMVEVNKPGSPLYDLLRKPGLKQSNFQSTVVHTQALAAGNQQVADIKATISISGVQYYPTYYGPDVEWNGLLEVVATINLKGTGPKMLVVDQMREIKTRCISSPIQPMGKKGFYDAARKVGMFPPKPQKSLTMDRPSWKQRATHIIKVAPGGDMKAAFDGAMANGVLNGVVYVDNAGGPDLDLSGYSMKGKAVIVTAGPLKLNNTRVADKSLDAFVYLAFGDTDVTGQIDGCMIYTYYPGDPKPRRNLAGGTKFHGAMLNLYGDCGGKRFPLTNGLTGNYVDYQPETLVASAGNGARPFPDRIYVAVSPTVLLSKEVTK
jgi:hypothetical protein